MTCSLATILKRRLCHRRCVRASQWRLSSWPAGSKREEDGGNDGIAERKANWLRLRSGCYCIQRRPLAARMRKISISRKVGREERCLSDSQIIHRACDEVEGGGSRGEEMSKSRSRSKSKRRSRSRKQSRDGYSLLLCTSGGDEDGHSAAAESSAMCMVHGRLAVGDVGGGGGCAASGLSVWLGRL